jgi:hypothetical protein
MPGVRPGLHPRVLLPGKNRLPLLSWAAHGGDGRSSGRSRLPAIAGASVGLIPALGGHRVFSPSDGGGLLLYPVVRPIIPKIAP